MAPGRQGDDTVGGEGELHGVDMILLLWAWREVGIVIFVVCGIKDSVLNLTR